MYLKKIIKSKKILKSINNIHVTSLPALLKRNLTNKPLVIFLVPKWSFCSKMVENKKAPESLVSQCEENSLIIIYYIIIFSNIV